MARILFVTGTDTGVGKTLVTASLLYYLRHRAAASLKGRARLSQSGARVLAMKPFCSGSRADLRLIQAIQSGAMPDEQANPYFFRASVAPLVAARALGKRISLDEVLRQIANIGARCEHLIVEGAGGLLAPLGEGPSGKPFSAADLITELNCGVCLVAANKLGVINHTSLTVRALQNAGVNGIRIVLSQTSWRADASVKTNATVISELLAPNPVIPLPYFGPRASTVESIERRQRKTAAVWQKILK